jgi:hypothetical protein
MHGIVDGEPYALKGARTVRRGVHSCRWLIWHNGRVKMCRPGMSSLNGCSCALLEKSSLERCHVRLVRTETRVRFPPPKSKIHFGFGIPRRSSPKYKIHFIFGQGVSPSFSLRSRPNIKYILYLGGASSGISRG